MHFLTNSQTPKPSQAVSSEPQRIFDDSAAKRRKNAAHGASRGDRDAHGQRAPEGRKKLIPDVSLVVGYVVPLEECDKLLLKRMLFVMLFLSCNIFCDSCDIRLAHTENAVSGLPGEFCIPFFMDPP